MKVYEEEVRTPVGRPDFKFGEGRTTSLVGSTPTLFRHLSRKHEECRPGKVEPIGDRHRIGNIQKRRRLVIVYFQRRIPHIERVKYL